MSFRAIVRIIAPTAATSVVLLLLGGVAAWYLDRLQRESSHLLGDSVDQAEAAEELEIISHKLRYNLSQYLSAPDEQSLAAVSGLRSQATHWLGKAREAADTDRQKALIHQIDRGYVRLFNEFAKIIQGSRANAHPQKVLNLIHNIAANEILEPAQELRDLNRRLMTEASARDQAAADRMGIGLLLLGTCGAVAGLLAGYGIARGIHRSLAQLTVPVRDATGKLNEVVGPITVSSGETFEELETALQDMAERVGTVVKELQESQLAASRAQQLAAMGQLAAGLAHELRNPLTSMKMLVQPAGDEAEAVQLDTKDLTVLRQEIERLERAIQTFLDYARPPKLEKRPLLLRQVLQETVDFVRPRAEQLGIQIQAELPREGVQAEADPGQIRQVLLNLLLNALDASSEGKAVTVRMACERAGPWDGAAQQSRADACDWMRIEVADRGPGLPSQFGQRIFEPFVSTKEGGTGLGLPVCKRIVEDHGGEIWAENRPGGGAIFAVRLPVASSPVPTASRAHQVRPGVTS